MYSEPGTKASQPGATRWRPSREAPQVDPKVDPKPGASQAPALQDTHNVFLVDYFMALVEEYPTARPWAADLFSAMVGDTPALSSAPCPSLPAAHAQAHLHLMSCEVGRLLSRYPRAVLTGLIEGLRGPSG